AMINAHHSEAMIHVPDVEEEDLPLQERPVPKIPSHAWMAVRAVAAVVLAAGGVLGVVEVMAPKSLLSPSLLGGSRDWKADAPEFLELNEMDVSDGLPPDIREMMSKLRHLVAGRVYRYDDDVFDDTEKVDCSIDVAQTVFRLMEAANAIVQAVDFDCKKSGGIVGLATGGERGNVRTNDDRLRCSSSILTAIYSFVIAGTEIAASVSDCVPTYDVRAQCTAAITSFAGNLLVTVQSGIGSDLACAPSKEARLEWARRWRSRRGLRIPASNLDDTPVLKKINEIHQKLVLPPNPLENYTNPVNGRAVSRCIAFVGLGTTFLMRMGTGITASVHQCDPYTIANTKSGRRLCSVDMMGLIGSLGLATSFLSGAVDACGLIKGDGFRDAACAASISGVVGGLSAAMASDAQLISTCSRGELADDAL
ncbi:cta4, partial [Symbiodinium necroappetens]